MIAWIVFYYLIGAIPFGYLAGRIRCSLDSIRT